MIALPPFINDILWLIFIALIIGFLLKRNFYYSEMDKNIILKIEELEKRIEKLEKLIKKGG